MKYSGRISIVIIYVTIVIGWHSFYFLADLEASYEFMFVHNQIKWDLLFIPLFSPLFWWLGKQYDAAKFLSEKDALTGLYNRRYMTKVTPKLITKMDKKIDTLTISVLDCNNFKQINDQYGHETGDLVLQNVSLILASSIGKRDIAARWGGDEFLIVCPHANMQKTRAMSERIAAGLQQLSTELGMDISVSIGMAVYPRDASNIQDLLIAADRQMYECKMKRVPS
ncbi:GGDEF domain-containing protein [Neobacillus muris]|uniref:GGDEF domain-containing protein n=1 Tax=Neobacillus muris TaxID=2941334 RepID=UPI00203CEEBF|nr:GGDEF domain-containing protein [Neobacillus muris]